MDLFKATLNQTLIFQFFSACAGYKNKTLPILVEAIIYLKNIISLISSIQVIKRNICISDIKFLIIL